MSSLIILVDHMYSKSYFTKIVTVSVEEKKHNDSDIGIDLYRFPK